MNRGAGAARARAPRTGPCVVAVTGAAGFVGAAVCADLEAAGHTVVRVMRSPLPEFSDAVVWDICEDSPRADPGGWTDAGEGGRARDVDAVVHCAAAPSTADVDGTMRALQ